MRVSRYGLLVLLTNVSLHAANCQAATPYIIKSKSNHAAEAGHIELIAWERHPVELSPENERITRVIAYARLANGETGTVFFDTLSSSDADILREIRETLRGETKPLLPFLY